MSRPFKSVLAATTALFIQPAVAQDEPYDLGTIFVSGGLTPIEGSAYGRAGSVITEEEIEDRNAVYVADLLRSLPGVSVSRTGAYGSVTQVRLRGHEGNHTLVLIDGIEVAAPNTGEYDFSGLLAADIERIEVIRGPQSALYGSNAIGGVISITTKTAQEPGFSGNVGFEVGSDGTTEGRLGLRLNTERGQLSFSAARRETGGFDISGTPGGEDDGDLNRTYNLKGRYRVNEVLTIGGSIRHVDRTGDSDGFDFGAPTRAGLVDDDLSGTSLQETYGGVFAELDTLGGRLLHRVDLSFGAIDRQDLDDAAVRDSDISDTRAKIAYRGTVALDTPTLGSANHTLTFGAEWERLTYKENDPTLVAPRQPVRSSREQTAIAFEYQGDFGNGFALQGSVRHDFNDKFEDFTTYAIGASYQLPNQRTRLHASYGTGVQNPTLIEQFGFSGDFVGNPNLEPEQSKGWDFGVEQQFLNGRGLIDVTYFNEELTDEITAVYDPVTFIGTPVNQRGKSVRQGIEVAASLAATDLLDMSLSYTWLDAENPDGSIETRRPEHEALLRLGYLMPNDRTRLNLEVQHVAGLFDSDFTAASLGANVVELQDYTLVNVGFSHEVTDDIQVYGRIHNVTDESYEELDGYSTQGRTAFFGVTANF